MREKPVKLSLVTIGQSPRNDLWDEIAQNLDFPFESYHFGLLDTPESLERLLAGSSEKEILVTQLRTGDAARISSQKAHPALINLIAEIAKWEKPDAIIVLCTGIREPESAFPFPVIYPGVLIRNKVMENPVELTGVILPDKNQWDWLDPELKKRKAILFEIDPPGTEQEFQKAADYLTDRKVRSVIFHCMGYPLSAAAPFSSDFTEQIAHPRLLISQALNQRFGNILPQRTHRPRRGGAAAK
ncbi:AroM family protein [Candidatus Sumerlaeota bacterium]|nr:AroM family protein [Candidatus Sumerlaeota bacterium]